MSKSWKVSEKKTGKTLDSRKTPRKREVESARQEIQNIMRHTGAKMEIFLD